jgi:hemophore-related protein
MKLSSKQKIAISVSGLALAMTAGAGLASADPDWSPMVNSTCTYDQAMAAVHTENPMAAQYLDQSPPNLKFLQVFLSSSRDQRVSLLNQIKNNPGADQALPVFQQTLTSCTKY